MSIKLSCEVKKINRQKNKRNKERKGRVKTPMQTYEEEGRWKGGGRVRGLPTVRSHKREKRKGNGEESHCLALKKARRPRLGSMLVLSPPALCIPKQCAQVFVLRHGPFRHTLSPFPFSPFHSFLAAASSARHVIVTLCTCLAEMRERTPLRQPHTVHPPLFGTHTSCASATLLRFPTHTHTLRRRGGHHSHAKSMHLRLHACRWK